MKNSTSTELDPGSVALRLGMCAAALLGVAAAPAANAAVVSFTTPIVVPQTVSGVYINLLTGATGTSSALIGWDFNPYLANSGTQLGFYWAGGAAGVATNSVYQSLAAGTTVSSARTFSQAALGTNSSAFLSSGTNILGFRFLNETTGQTDYGYMTIATGSGAGFPATIQGWSFENSGTAITIPAVPEPSSLALLSLGAIALGAVNLRNIRRRSRNAVATQ